MSLIINNTLTYVSSQNESCRSSLSLIREPFAYFQLFTDKKIMRCDKGRNILVALPGRGVAVINWLVIYAAKTRFDNVTPFNTIYVSSKLTLFLGVVVVVIAW